MLCIEFLKKYLVVQCKNLQHATVLGIPSFFIRQETSKWQWADPTGTPVDFSLWLRPRRQWHLESWPQGPQLGPQGCLLFSSKWTTSLSMKRSEGGHDAQSNRPQRTAGLGSQRRIGRRQPCAVLLLAVWKFPVPLTKPRPAFPEQHPRAWPVTAPACEQVLGAGSEEGTRAARVTDSLRETFAAHPCYLSLSSTTGRRPFCPGQASSSQAHSH